MSGAVPPSGPGLGRAPVGRLPHEPALFPAEASKPGVCMKVLTIEPPQADLQLREDLALLADCALPPELRVRSRPGLRLKPRAWRSCV